MRVVVASNEEVFSARCPECWSVLYFSRRDVHQPNKPVEINIGEKGIGSANVPFVVCPICGEIVTEIYDLKGIHKVSGKSR